MQSLTEVIPHPLTSTLVPTAIALLSKLMGCLVVSNEKAGLTWNITLGFGYFPIRQDSRRLLICVIFLRVLTIDFNFSCVHFVHIKGIFKTFFALCEQKVYIFHLKHSPDLLLLMTAKFYRMLKTCRYVLPGLGERFELRFYWIVKIFKICNRTFVSAEINGLRILLTAFRQFCVTFCIVI